MGVIFYNLNGSYFSLIEILMGHPVKEKKNKSDLHESWGSESASRDKA
jgi:hypothetical protein